MKYSEKKLIVEYKRYQCAEDCPDRKTNPNHPHLFPNNILFWNERDKDGTLKQLAQKDFEYWGRHHKWILE